MAPVTHSDRYSESIDFWRNVYGIDSEYDGFYELALGILAQSVINL